VGENAGVSQNIILASTTSGCSMWNPNGVTVAGGNGSGSAANQLYYPYSIAVSPSGDIYVADTGNNRIQFWGADATQGE
jgi:hypothetical protein